MMDMPKRLKECREAAGESHAEVAAVLKIDRSTYTKYETGDREPDLAKIKLLASHYNVTVDYLICFSDTPSKSFVEELREYEDTKRICELLHYTRDLEIQIARRLPHLTYSQLARIDERINTLVEENKDNTPVLQEQQKSISDEAI